MANLLTARNLTKSFAMNTLFTEVSIGLDDDDRVGVIGPNGAGKSTLLKILAGIEETDDGEIVRRRQLRLAYLPQDDVFPEGTTPSSAAIAAAEATPTTDGLDPATRAAITLSKLGFENHERLAAELSGGWRKRLSLACALVADPDILLLDEPTNHLDLDGVLWLEQFARRAQMAIVFITHDRMFLDRVATRVVELSDAYPDGLFEVKGNYTEFVRRKEAFLEMQSMQQSVLANKVRRDTAWLRQGIQGRQTRNKTQVDDSTARRKELDAIKSRNLAPTKTTTIDFQATERKTRRLLTANRISRSMGDKLLFKELDLELTPGRRLGLVGPNGAGKTTLLRVLSGVMEPDSGTVKPAADLNIVTFSQHRDTLDPKASLQTALCPVGDTIDYRGKDVHITGWAKRFLFDVDQLSTPIGTLSGGEQARVLIANLMLSPADILLLDEPTNDLDIPSMEVLEQAVLEFPGAVILVTHDRFMLQRLATEILALDGTGGSRHHASYEQWESERTAAEKAAKQTARDEKKKPKQQKKKAADGGLTYKEQLELRGMEETILTAESAVETLTAQCADPEIMTDHARYADLCKELATAQSAVEALYARWADLEARS